MKHLNGGPRLPSRAKALLRSLIALVAAFHCMAASAAVEVNTASVADLDGIKGIGPALSAKILKAREQGPFEGWTDLVARVQGMGKTSAARLSNEGLTVNGAAFGQSPTAAAPQPPIAGASR
ncbi:ComEA family DNA-binding protein [Acidovorax sp. NCPPB 3576]|uniref:ComEA family DNA-binding protein n=1 Tax=Acidovorax sp. NCPPB 3576 TaxID=2940488 RepID=UPI00234A9AF9|nr:helix-hairpin-helix domain-containing protein [Acidovorax sp. NCPPB 3576]WCM86391.1 helix-hairpin-helix domain-containing protein [Acidovorax sp. NCPPB 3576]